MINTMREMENLFMSDSLAHGFLRDPCVNMINRPLKKLQ